MKSVRPELVEGRTASALRTHLAHSRRSLAKLDVLATRRRLTRMEREAAFLRLSFASLSIEKAAQRYLTAREGIEIGSPKACIRSSHALGLLTPKQAEVAFEMAKDRNDIVRTYKAAIAERIRRRLPRYAKLLRIWLDAIDKAARAA